MMRRLLLCTAVAIALGVIAIVGAAIASLNRLDDAYAQWGAADMLVDYMSDHDGDWPSQWTDLKPYFDAGGGRVSGWDFNRFTEHVWIDFTANADDLRAASASSDSAPFDVVGSTSIFGPCFGDGPDGMLHRHFNPDAPNPNPPTTATVVSTVPQRGR
tara:strand:+ start:340 stop:813 length:474 start_codon:yes stop_codon:yes gene_type:complete